MSPLAEPPPPPVETARRKPRGLGFSSWLSEKPETRSIQIGVAATILVHLILLISAPYWFKAEPIVHHPKNQNKTFRIHLLPPQKKLVTKHKIPPKFVETNPNAPENKPDHTINVSNRDQQSAQEKASKIRNTDMPAQEGKKDFKNDQIVNGSLAKQQPPSPPVVQPNKVQPKVRLPPHRREDPLAGHVKNLGADPKNIGSYLAPPTPNERPISHPVAGDETGPQLDIPTFAPPVIDPSHPQSRPMLDVHSRPAVIADNANGTPRVGIIGRDAHWDPYGDYLERLEEAVQMEWDRIMDRVPFPPPGSTVTITFVLNSSGEISKIVHVETSQSCTEIGEHACADALKNPAPYGKWTEGMIAVLGNEQTLTFSFLYE
ncbi:MAG TPA: hypothetical protein VGL42_01100 [Opitutaceae bacterium]|jgi:hypothetical protein